MPKKSSLVALAIAIIASLGLPAKPVSAKSDGGIVEFTATRTTQVANGNSLITFKVFLYQYKCGLYYEDTPTCPDGSVAEKTPQANFPVTIYHSGGGNIFSGTKSWANGVPYVTTGADGRAQFTLASSSAGLKTLTASSDLTEGTHLNTAGGYPSIKVTFTAPVTATPKPTATTPAPTPKLAPTPPPTPAPTLSVGNKTIKPTDTITLEANESLKLSGTTAPNATVKLFIFSTPKEATTTADANGHWTYEVKGLEPGQHHVEAQITDPLTKLSSARVTVATFAVAEPKAAATPAKSPSWLNFLWAGLVVLVVAGLSVWWVQRRRIAAKASQPPEAETVSS